MKQLRYWDACLANATVDIWRGLMTVFYDRLDIHFSRRYLKLLLFVDSDFYQSVRLHKRLKMFYGAFSSSIINCMTQYH